MSDLGERVRKYIGQMPASVEGSGGNASMFAVCSVLVNGFSLPEGEALQLALEWSNVYAVPPWPERELERMVKSAAERGSEKGVGYLLGKGESWKAGQAGEGVKAAPKRRDESIPKYDAEKLVAVVKAAPVAASRPEYFMERSPVDPRSVTGAEFLDLMFKPADRVLVFTDLRSQGDFLHEVGKGSYRLGAEKGVKAVASALPSRGAEGVWFLNQPITGQWLPNREGKFSRRSEDNVCGWVHWVMESDSAPEELWLRWLSISPAPVKAIYSSGGRSWHALVRCSYRTKIEMDADLARAKRSLSILGADPGALTALRLTRLPGCKRGMREQRLIYLDPTGDAGVISLLPKVRSVQ